MNGRPRTLRWAAGIIVVQAGFEVAYVAGRSDLTWGLRIVLMLVLSLQFVFARGALRLSAGSVLGQLPFEAMAVVAAIASDGPLVVRGALALTAVSVMVLLLMSISAFPSPELPKVS